MIKITADGEGNVSIGFDADSSTKLFAEFGCIILAFMRTMDEEGINHVSERTLNMVRVAAQQFNNGGD